MSQQDLVLDGVEDLINEGFEWSEVSIGLVDVNGVPKRTWLRSLLETILSLVLGFLRGGGQTVALPSLLHSPARKSVC